MSIQEVNYRKYYEKLEQARIDQALEIGKISNISIVQPATFPMVPIKPNKMRNLALGLFLGIFGAVGLAFFSEYIDHTFRKPEDIEERLKLPTLAAIPDSGKKDIFLIQ
jgi:capsular polysaccharide biosynthesis protein